MPKQYRVMWSGEEILTTEPGKYTGWRKGKIFGHLDCPSGRRKIHPENRIFFRDWDDAIDEGYRPCKICRPEIPRLNEHLSVFHPAMQKLHVAIYKTNPGPYPDKPSVCFYVTLNWSEEDDETRTHTSYQLDLESWLPYPAAITKALHWGRLLGLPVIDHFFKADNLVRYAPKNNTSSLEHPNAQLSLLFQRSDEIKSITSKKWW